MTIPPLIVGSSFDPSGITSGLSIGTASLAQFEAAVRAVAKRLPELDASTLATAVAGEVKSAAAEVDRFNAKIKASVDLIKQAQIGGILAGQLQQVPAAAQDAGASVSRMNAAFDVSGRAAARAAADHAKVAQGFANLSNSSDKSFFSIFKLSKGFEVGRQGGRRLESALTAMSFAAAGMEGPIARIGEGLVLFAGAELPILEIAAAIGAAVIAYQILTKAQHDATKARDELVKKFQQRLQANVSDINELQKEIAAQEELRAITEKRAQGLIRLNESLKSQGGIQIGGKLLELTTLREDREKGILLLKQLQVNAEIQTLNFQKQQQAQTISDLAAAPGLDTDNLASIQQRQAEMTRLTKLIRDQHTSLRDRNEAQQQYNSLLDANLVRAERVLAITQRTTQESLQQFQQLAGKPGLQAGAVTATGPGSIAAAGEELAKAADRADALRAKLDQSSAAALRLAATSRELRQMEGAIQDLIAASQQLPGQNDRGVGLARTQLQGPGGTGTGTLAQRQGQQIQAAMSNAEAGLATVNTAFDTLNRHLIQTNAEWRKFTKQVEDTRTPAEKMADSFNAIGSAISTIGGIGQSLGFLGEDAARAFQSVAALSDSLANLKLNPGSFSGILGVAGAAAGVLSSIPGLFGKTATETEHDQLLKQNSDRLAELRAALLTTTEQLTAAHSILASVTNPLQGQHFGKVAGPLTISDSLDASLKAAGLSLQEFAIIVKQQTGIEILDSKGRLIGKAFDDARIAIDLTTEAQKRAAAAAALAEGAAIAEAGRLRMIADLQERQAQALQHSIDVTNAAQANLPGLLGLRDQLENNSATTDATKAIQAFNDALLVVGNLNPNLLDQFRGFDLNDPAARQELRQRVLDMVNQLLAGNTFGGDIGEAGSPEFQAFIDFLNNAADSLDSFDKTTQDAVKSLTNMPVGINLQAIEFQAQAGTGGGRGGLPSTAKGGIPGAVDFGGAGRIINTGDTTIEIHQLPGENEASLVQRLLEEMGLRANATTGDPADAFTGLTHGR